MPATVGKYVPLLFSERLVPDKMGQLDLCRAATLAMGWDACTLGEWTTNRNGSRWGKKKIKSNLSRMRKMIGDLDGYNQSHMDDFLLAVKAPRRAWIEVNGTFDELRDALADDFTVTASGDVKDTPADSKMRRFVNAGVAHSVLYTCIHFREGKPDIIGYIDPMTPHGTPWYRRHVPAWHAKGFLERFSFREGGEKRYVWGKMKKGHYTEAKAVARDRSRTILELQNRQLEYQRMMNDQDLQIELLEKQVDELKDELDGMAGSPPPEEIGPELLTIRQAVDKIESVLQSQGTIE